MVEDGMVFYITGQNTGQDTIFGERMDMTSRGYHWVGNSIDVTGSTFSTGINTVNYRNRSLCGGKVSHLLLTPMMSIYTALTFGQKLDATDYYLSPED